MRSLLEVVNERILKALEGDAKDKLMYSNILCRALFQMSHRCVEEILSIFNMFR